MRNSPFLGVCGGIFCILAGALMLGFRFEVDASKSTIPLPLYFGLAFFFIGMGCFAAGMSLNGGCCRCKDGEKK